MEAKDVGYVFSKQDVKEYFIDEIFINQNPKCWEIIKLISDNPFTTQEEICEKFNLSKEELIKKNNKIRESDWAQDYIINAGIGSKYWKNTIIPTIQNGKAKAVLDESYSYPDRIGLCPGLSCMFFCSFCGRNYSASYEQEFGEKGFQVYKKIIDETPKGVNKKKVYHITGGLEPLTFPRIGDLISYAHNKGFDIEMQTNGYNLTPDFIKKQHGIKDLAVLRVSLYGIDHDSTTEVTKNKTGYDKVRKNLVDFLKLKTGIKVGLNYVLLQNNLDHALKLLDYIKEINIESGNQIDFLTLREDFSDQAKVISGKEREKLHQIFNEVEIKLEDRNLDHLHIDYGYALEAIRKNKKSFEPLKRVDYKQLRPKVFPQIAVMIDPKGDVYAYHEATFLDREGAKRYSIGVIDEQHSLQDVITNFLNGKGIEPLPSDTAYLDAFDHVTTLFLNQLETDIKFGISWSQGPMKI